MPIDDLQQAAHKLAEFMAALNRLGGMRLKYRISAEGGEEAGRAGGHEQRLHVELSGPDLPLLIQHNGELLAALETLAVQMLRLDPHEQLISFDAGNFKALHEQEMRLAAEAAAEKVRKSGQPYAFPPMNSHERRLLHMAFRTIEGVETASSGEGSERFLAVYPAGQTNLPVTPPQRPRGYSRR